MGNGGEYESEDFCFADVVADRCVEGKNQLKGDCTTYDDQKLSLPSSGDCPPTDDDDDDDDRRRRVAPGPAAAPKAPAPVKPAPVKPAPAQPAPAKPAPAKPDGRRRRVRQ
ncbi:unnamed protein product [Vitrella brassicaformis CCMP3155]|uniref:Uncharacterized protein n=1 Tax=Vitrella brassicaformis (strain CCMP3155) TaxID=1169540 RepID=A0A0G4FQ97_VITBC|nr:unnamed protein product [Vitrella brassicaformis CCMP3155]|eukprot:CEM16613.1 unnamed protein product [Vitrella brassicaformis CCMP3155]